MRAPALVRLLRLAEIVLLVAGLAALGWFGYSHTSAARDQADWARELDAQAAAAAAAPPAVAAARKRTPPAPGSLIGRLEVPRLGLSVITREGTDARTLRRAVGHVPATALPGEHGNAAFAGHRDTFFRGLKNIRRGDRVVITTAEGSHTYIVRDTTIVTPRDVSVLDPTDTATLTLVTCYPFNFIGAAPKRFIVRATLIDDHAVATVAGGSR